MFPSSPSKVLTLPAPGKLSASFPVVNFLIGFAGVALAGLFLITHPIEITTDGTGYLLSAKFLQRGLGYLAYGFESQEIVPQINWPPLFSFATALVMKGSGRGEIDSVRAVNFLSLLAYYLSFYWLMILLFKERLSQVLGNLFIVIAPLVWGSLNMAQSELLFMGLFGFSMALLLGASVCEIGVKRNILFFAGGIATMLLCLTRYSGLFLALPYGVFLLVTKNPHGLRQKFLGGFLFSLPVVVGTGGWLVRNKLVSGHLTFFEVYPWQTPSQNFFVLEVDFLRKMIESLVGYTTYGWPQGPVTFIPAFAFLSCFVFVGWVVWLLRKDLFRNQTGSHFASLASITVFFYLLAHNALKLKYGFGDSPRYLTVLSPVIFLSSLFLIRGLMQANETPLKRSRNLSAAILAFFLVFAGFFQSINVLKSAVDTMRRKSTSLQGAYFPAFENSKWVFEFVRMQIKDRDILISNNPAFLSYGGDRPCRTTWPLSREASRDSRGHAVALLALEEVKDSSREVYLVIEKKLPCLLEGNPDWQGYLQGLRHEVVREDDAAIALRLLR